MTWQQFRVLTWKNWLLKKRSPCGTICQLLTPVIFALIASFTVYVATSFGDRIDGTTLPMPPLIRTYPLFDCIWARQQDGWTDKCLIALVSNGTAIDRTTFDSFTEEMQTQLAVCDDVEW
jgi:hypothetical protein